MSIVEMHSSWLAINSIVGCPNGCKYCLLQAFNNNKCLPKIHASPEESVNELLNYKYYDKEIPICLLPNTDVFINSSNINYLLKLIDELDKRNIMNDLIIITKCKITEDVIKRVKKLKTKGQNVVFYVSYSGLERDIEPNISKSILRENFKKLKESGIDIIHYYRPFIPQNSEPKRIKETLDCVSQYTEISITTGLALIETFIDKIEFFNEIKENREACLKANSVWPETAWNYFNNNYNHQQQVFQTNICGLNSKLKRPSTIYYGTEECLKYNHCSEEQRKLCKIAYQRVNEKLLKETCTKLLKQLGFNTTYVKYILDEYESLEIQNLDLEIRDISYLSYKLGRKVYITTNKIVKDTYNSTLNGAKPLILKVGVKK